MRQVRDPAAPHGVGERSVERKPRSRREQLAGRGDRLGEADAADRHALRRGAAQPARQLPVEHDEDPAIALVAHQPAERLLQPQPRQHLVIAAAPERLAPGAMQQGGPGPRYPVEDDQPQRAARHVDAVAHRVGAEAGDRVLFGKWSGTEVKIDGEELLIMKESDLLGIIEK